MNSHLNKGKLAIQEAFEKMRTTLSQKEVRPLNFMCSDIPQTVFSCLGSGGLG